MTRLHGAARAVWRARRGGTPHPRRGVASRLLPIVLLALAGCAGRPPVGGPLPESLPAGSPLLSSTLSRGDAWLRHHLMFQQYRAALDVLDGSREAPSDPLLRALQKGLVLHHAGEHAQSNRVLAWAEQEADRRLTRSLTRAAGSLVVNDRVLAYSPLQVELAMIPYYRIKNYLALGDLQGAVVEARKANALLARQEESGDRCRDRAMVEYLAGLVQHAAGEANDALVSLRRAEQAFRTCGDSATLAAPPGLGADLYRVASALGVLEVADSAAARYAFAPSPARPQEGDLVLLVEHGFVAHPAEHALQVPVFPTEIQGLEGGSGDDIAAAAARISARLLQNLAEQATWGHSLDDSPLVQLENALEGAYLLRLAWPVLRREARRPDSVRVWVGDSLAAVAPVGELSTPVQQELEGRRAAALARMVARGIGKYLLTREVEKKAEARHGEIAGFLVGRLSNLAANETERADTRSWSLLPDRISMVRLRLPAGSYRVRLESLGTGGTALSVRELEVTVRAGGLALVSERVWGDDDGTGRAADLPAGSARTAAFSRRN